MSNNYNFNSMMKTMLAMVPFAASMASAATIVKRISVDDLIAMQDSNTAFQIYGSHAGESLEADTLRLELDVLRSGPSWITLSVENARSGWGPQVDIQDQGVETHPQTGTKTFAWEITGGASALETELIFEEEFGARVEVGLDILERSQDCTQGQEDALSEAVQGYWPTIALDHDGILSCKRIVLRPSWVAYKASYPYTNRNAISNIKISCTETTDGSRQPEFCA